MLPSWCLSLGEDKGVAVLLQQRKEKLSKESFLTSENAWSSLGEDKANDLLQGKTMLLHQRKEN